MVLERKDAMEGVVVLTAFPQPSIMGAADATPCYVKDYGRMLMRRKLYVLAITTAVALLLFCLPGCGGYPHCVQTSHCASHNQVCHEKRCVDCKTARDCNQRGQCGDCNNGRCTPVPNCCLGNTDCSKSQRCWNVPGKPFGQCGNRR